MEATWEQIKDSELESINLSDLNSTSRTSSRSTSYLARVLKTAWWASVGVTSLWLLQDAVLNHSRQIANLLVYISDKI